MSWLIPYLSYGIAKRTTCERASGTNHWQGRLLPLNTYTMPPHVALSAHQAVRWSKSNRAHTSSRSPHRGREAPSPGPSCYACGQGEQVCSFRISLLRRCGPSRCWFVGTERPFWLGGQILERAAAPSFCLRVPLPFLHTRHTNERKVSSKEPASLHFSVCVSFLSWKKQVGFLRKTEL